MTFHETVDTLIFRTGFLKRYRLMNHKNLNIGAISIIFSR